MEIDCAVYCTGSLTKGYIFIKLYYYISMFGFRILKMNEWCLNVVLLHSLSAHVWLRLR